MRGVRLHWLGLSESLGQRSVVPIVDALSHAVLCQTPRAAIATLDSALNRGLLVAGQLSNVFDLLPERYRLLERLVDGRAESGPESLMRLMLRGLGCDVQVQVQIDGVGRVDLVVDGWLIVECDSREFHGGWEAQEKDRRRDLAAATAGYATIRPTATMITDEPDAILAAVRGLLTGAR